MRKRLLVYGATPWPVWYLCVLADLPCHLKGTHSRCKVHDFMLTGWIWWSLHYSRINSRPVWECAPVSAYLRTGMCVYLFGKYTGSMFLAYSAYPPIQRDLTFINKSPSPSPSSLTHSFTDHLSSLSLIGNGLLRRTLTDSLTAVVVWHPYEWE